MSECPVLHEFKKQLLMSSRKKKSLWSNQLATSSSKDNSPVVTILQDVWDGVDNKTGDDENIIGDITIKWRRTRPG